MTEERFIIDFQGEGMDLEELAREAEVVKGPLGDLAKIYCDSRDDLLKYLAGIGFEDLE